MSKINKFKAKTQRSADGKYIFLLHFKQDYRRSISLGPSMKAAYVHLYQNEMPVAKNSEQSPRHWVICMSRHPYNVTQSAIYI